VPSPGAAQLRRRHQGRARPAAAQSGCALQQPPGAGPGGGGRQPHRLRRLQLRRGAAVAAAGRRRRRRRRLALRGGGGGAAGRGGGREVGIHRRPGGAGRGAPAAGGPGRVPLLQVGACPLPAPCLLLPAPCLLLLPGGPRRPLPRASTPSWPSRRRAADLGPLPLPRRHRVWLARLARRQSAALQDKRSRFPGMPSVALAGGKGLLAASDVQVTWVFTDVEVGSGWSAAAGPQHQKLCAGARLRRRAAPAARRAARSCGSGTPR
jgi:hypothetical protein